MSLQWIVYKSHIPVTVAVPDDSGRWTSGGSVGVSGSPTRTSDSGAVGD